MSILVLILAGGALLLAIMSLVRPQTWPFALAVAVILLAILAVLEHSGGTIGALHSG